MSIAQGSEPKPPALRYRDGQIAALRTRHGRLNDRQPNPEQFLQCHDAPPRAFYASIAAADDEGILN